MRDGGRLTAAIEVLDRGRDDPVFFAERFLGIRLHRSQRKWVRYAAMREEGIEALAVALTERDRYTGEHSEAVIEMSGSVARNLGLGAAAWFLGGGRRVSSEVWRAA